MVMLGGLHTEMALWNTLGDVLEDSGWTAALTEAEIASWHSGLLFEGVTPYSYKTCPSSHCLDPSKIAERGFLAMRQL